jgi:16S rRNA (adenine1518-N6/adenine1519-N6)-dimethyltransferase
MVQKEVADKLCMDARKKSYLRWIVNYAYEVVYLKTVPAKAFSPAPKVTSALIKLKKNPDIPTIDFEVLLKFLDDFSPYSRKTLGAIATLNRKRHNKDWHIPEDIK